MAAMSTYSAVLSYMFDIFFLHRKGGAVFRAVPKKTFMILKYIRKKKSIVFLKKDEKI